MLPIRRSYRPYYMTDFFNTDFDRFERRHSSKPAVNIREDEKSFTIEMALAGVKKDDIKVEIDKDVLTISSEINDEKNSNENGYSRREFGYGSFCRSFTIPENTESEKISASFKDGILYIEIPRAKEEAKVNRVIKVS